MISHYLFQLRFTSPVHIGDSSGGGGLEKCDKTIYADSLFSAICCELSDNGENRMLEDMVSMVRSGKLAFSDLMPYRMDEKGNLQCFLPKPMHEYFPEDNSDSLTGARMLSLHKKKIKRLEYVRAVDVEAYYRAAADGKKIDFPDGGSFYQEDIMERVNCRTEETLPYYVKLANFHNNTGLYGIVTIHSDSVQEIEEKVELIQQILTMLGYTGIGGKRSSGYGHFELDNDMLPLAEADYYEDAAALNRMLNDDRSDVQMNISILHPSKDDLDYVREGRYKIKKRSGFTGNIKHNSIYMIEAGSCFKKRLTGDIVDLNDGAAEHPIYRYGMGMYVGLRL